MNTIENEENESEASFSLTSNSKGWSKFAEMVKGHFYVQMSSSKKDIEEEQNKIKQFWNENKNSFCVLSIEDAAVIMRYISSKLADALHLFENTSSNFYTPLLEKDRSMPIRFNSPEDELATVFVQSGCGWQFSSFLRLLNLNEKNYLLFLHAQQGNIDCVRELVKVHRADVNFKVVGYVDENLNEKSILFTAIEKTHYDTVKLLLESGANPDLQLQRTVDEYTSARKLALSVKSLKIRALFV